MNGQQFRVRLEALGAGPPTADWGDVHDRAARARVRRTRLLLAFATGAAILVAAPAFAVATGVIDFSRAEPAPEQTKLLFGELNTGAPPGMAPGVDAKETRAVLRRELFGRPHKLWVAPAKNGGFCMFLLGRRGGGGGGCETAGTPISPGGIRPGIEGTPVATFGSVAVPEATHVDVIHKDRSSTRVELVWVSPPIDVAFFVLEVSAERGVIGWVARDAAGNELARRMAPKPVGEVP